MIKKTLLAIWQYCICWWYCCKFILYVDKIVRNSYSPNTWCLNLIYLSERIQEIVLFKRLGHKGTDLRNDICALLMPLRSLFQLLKMQEIIICDPIHGHLKHSRPTRDLVSEMPCSRITRKWYCFCIVDGIFI